MSARERDVAPSGATLANRLWRDALDTLQARLIDARDLADLAGAAIGLAAPLLDEPRFAWLVETFELDARDQDLLLIAAAPQIDPRLADLYARWQGHVTADRASEAFALHLLCAEADARLALRARLSPQHVLCQQRLLDLATTRAANGEPRGPRALRVDPQILRTLFYEGGIDPRLHAYCRLIEPGEDTRALALPRETWRILHAWATQAWQERSPLRLHWRGAVGSGRRQTAQALAQSLGARLLLADLRLLGEGLQAIDALLPLLREAWLGDAVLYIEGIEALPAAGMQVELERLLEAIDQDAGVVIIATSPAWSLPSHRLTDARVIDFVLPDAAQRRALWQRELAARGLRLDEQSLRALANRFRMNPLQIARSVRAAEIAARGRDADAAPDADSLFSAARAQAPQDLSQLARKVVPAARWSDLVLPEDAREQLRELCQRVEHAERVLDQWGFGGRLNLGKGTSALFAGPSGTGKTMGAEVIAGELRLDLYKIDLATIVSKYIGETEKNLDRVFTAARNANAILLFDEADAIFGKRSEVRDSHDRYANLEIAYLLQKMEEYDGLSILATNLKQNMDDAFLRRLTYTVLFPFPDAADRERIWRKIWPERVPVSPAIDFARIAQHFKLSGGQIKNAALAAAYFASADVREVQARHVVHGIRRELQKQGKSMVEFEAVLASCLEPLVDAQASREVAHG